MLKPKIRQNNILLQVFKHVIVRSRVFALLVCLFHKIRFINMSIFD